MYAGRLAVSCWNAARSLAWLDCAPVRAASAPGPKLPRQAAYKMARCWEACSSTWVSAASEVTVCASCALEVPAAMSLSNAAAPR